MDPIERHIKQHFDNKDYTYNEAHWMEAQKLIAENKRRRRGWLYWWTGGVSVILLAVLALWTFSAETRVVSNGLVNNIASVSNPELGNSQSGTEEELDKTSINNSDNTNSESTNISEASIPAVTHVGSTSNTAVNRKKAGNYIHDSKALKNKTSNNNTKSGKANSTGGAQSEEDTNSNINTQPKFTETLFSENANESSTPVTELVAVEDTKIQNQSQNEAEVLKDSDLVLNKGAESESELPLIAIDGELESEKTEDLAVNQPITPVKKNNRFNWGFVAGYLMQKRFIEDQWLYGGYFGARASWRLTPKWSVGSDLSLVMQEMESVHFHHNVISGYGFGRDSLVTDLYAKRAITLQIPLAISYAIGRHTLTGMIGTRILLDGQARIEKSHYTNANPESTSAVIVSRSLATKKEELMPEGAIAPFSIYSGFRYGWMIGRGWGLETNVSMPLYHKIAKLDFGAKMAADRGIRLEIGVLKVF